MFLTEAACSFPFFFQCAQTSLHLFGWNTRLGVLTPLLGLGNESRIGMQTPKQLAMWIPDVNRLSGGS